MTSRRVFTYANIVATLALVLALGGTAYAGVKIGTKELKKNAVTSAKIKNGTVSAKDVKPGSLTAGTLAPGVIPTIPEITEVLWAVVNPDGTVNRSNGHVVSSAKVDIGGTIGSYEVIFDRDLTTCVYMGTLGGANTVDSVGEITTFPRNNNVNGAFAYTYDNAGVRADRLFQLAVLC